MRDISETSEEDMMRQVEEAQVGIADETHLFFFKKNKTVL